MIKINFYKVLLVAVSCVLVCSADVWALSDTTIKGTVSDSSAASLEITNSSNTSLMFIRNDGNVGIGDATPASLLTVGSADLFQVNSSGDMTKIKNVAYTWPGSQGAADSYLKNDGLGGLTWAAVASGSSALSAITAATGSNTILNGTNAQTWHWALAATGNTGFTFGENTAATAGGTILKAEAIAASTAVPFIVNNLGAADSFTVNDEAAEGTPFVVDASGGVGVGDPTPDAKLEILSTSEQLRLSRTDGSVDSRFSVDASGNLTIDNTGTKSVFADDVQVTGNDLLDSAAATRITLGATNIVTGNLSATGTLSSGTASTTTGLIALNNAVNANTITIQSGTTSASHTLTLPAAQGGASTFLKNNGAGALSWDTPTGTTPFAGKSANYTIALTDGVIAADASGGSVTITLPTAVGIDGRQFTVKRINTAGSNVTVDCTGGQTIDGDATQILTLPQTSITLVSDGSNWVIV